MTFGLKKYVRADSDIFIRLAQVEANSWTRILGPYTEKEKNKWNIQVLSINYNFALYGKYVI